jgi:hypothetical protein
MKKMYMNMKMSNVPPRVRIQVIKQDNDKDIKVAETRGRKALLFRSLHDTAVDGREGFERIDLRGTIEVLKTNKLLKLECLPLPPSKSAEFLINPVGVAYDVEDLFYYKKKSEALTVVLNRPGPIEVKARYVDQVYETPVPKPGTPYVITGIAVYAEVSWEEEWVNFDRSKDWENELLDDDDFEGTEPNLNRFSKVGYNYIDESTPVCYLGFSFLNDQGEWEPLMDFEVVEAVEAE